MRWQMSYVQTLIAVADDCPVMSSVVPTAHAGKKTVAVLQHELIAAQAHTLTQEDVLFEVWLRRQDPPSNPGDLERVELRERFFAKPQACLRSSPLPKRYGWGLLFDHEGKVALCPMESKEYRRLIEGRVNGIRIFKALRSSRA